MALYRLIKKRYADARHEYSPTWLGNQRFDIYVPSLRIAIEYNGLQHYQPIELFGGDEGFREMKKRDERKKRVAHENGVTVYIWPYTRTIGEKEVDRFITGLQDVAD
jgi:hypothetical protein